MQLLEAFNVAFDSLDSEKDPTCDKKDEDKGWKSRVNDYNSQEVCTGTRLYDNMNANRASHVAKGLGFVPTKTAGKSWKVDDVTEESFPVQAHHLIPKNFLPDHPVCRWLAIKYKKDAEFELKYDSDYDTDDSDNGYCMPYATPMKEWGGDANRKVAVAFQVMEKAKVQLHQGSHATVLDAAKLQAMAGQDIVPTVYDTGGGAGSDEMEEAKIHEPGYLNRVKLLLSMVDEKALAHAENCPVCKKNKKDGKTLVMPSQDTTKLMHRVSKIIKILVKADVMHVSGYAYYYAYNKRTLEVLDNKVYVRGTSRTQLQAELAK
ncbi:MAG TPA: hypothetical protein VMF52_05235 [Steroidobacteraceae bacterium]|nr:hypothetical protein [Steroidobacteraceae bacterium]